MAKYLVFRLVAALISIWAISVLTFIIIEVPPGNQVERFIDLFQNYNDVDPDPKHVETLRRNLGLDKPNYVRYSKWIWNLLRGKLGMSFQYREIIDIPVKEMIGDRLWLTIVLTGFTIIVTWTLAIPIGIYSAVRQHSIGDYVFTLVGFSGLAVPDFLLGLVLMYLFFAYLDMTVGGLFSADYINVPWSMNKVKDLIDHLWIPAIVLGTSGTAGLIRVMRNNLLDELSKPYVLTARSKGLSPLRLILKYPVRVAINPLVSTVGYLLPSLVSGSIIVSVVLSLPTLGPLLLEAIEAEDVNLSGFIILISGILTVIGTLLSDILLSIIDPRIRYEA